LFACFPFWFKDHNFYVAKNANVTDDMFVLQWWANHKSNHKSKSQITGKSDLNENLKSKIKSQIIKSNPNHFRPKSN